jgi:hypothetical protein
MLKNPSKYKGDTLLQQNSTFPSPVPSALLLDDSASRTARELWSTNQEFFIISCHHGSPRSYITGGQTIVPLVAAVQRRSLVSSHRHDHHHQRRTEESNKAIFANDRLQDASKLSSQKSVSTFQYI